MTTSFDADRYQHALERWRALAERRLAHMAQLYESGRWRHYFSEEEFIGVVRETRASVEHWRELVPGQGAELFAVPEKPPVARTQPPASPFADLPPVHESIRRTGDSLRF
jgi:uncharacterized repeat protein (TIGR03809 family)